MAPRPAKAVVTPRASPETELASAGPARRPQLGRRTQARTAAACTAPMPAFPLLNVTHLKPADKQPSPSRHTSDCCQRRFIQTGRHTPPGSTLRPRGRAPSPWQPTRSLQRTVPSPVECQSSPPRPESHCRSSLGAGGRVAWRSCRAQGPGPAHSGKLGSAALWRTRADARWWAIPGEPSTGAALPALGRLQAGAAEGSSRGSAGCMGRKSTGRTSMAHATASAQAAVRLSESACPARAGASRSQLGGVAAARQLCKQQLAHHLQERLLAAGRLLRGLCSLRFNRLVLRQSRQCLS